LWYIVFILYFPLIICPGRPHYFGSFAGGQEFASYTGCLSNHRIDLSTPAFGMFLSELIQYSSCTFFDAFTLTFSCEAVFHGYGSITGRQGFASYNFWYGIDLSTPASGIFLLQWKNNVLP
jgi:hypothetical protein